MEVKKYCFPYDHYIIDNFVDKDTARILSLEFLDYNSEKWFEYNNPLENKKTIREWGAFPKTTYKFFSELCGHEFTNAVQQITGCNSLIPDYGLHGAGWHIHKTGDHLNIHLDYDIHPLLNLQRKYNLILYLNDEWSSHWGGELELWTHDPLKNKPKDKAVSIQPLFNRAVLFDTTQNSWHGFSNKLSCPEGVYRKSIAMYYLTPVNLSKLTPPVRKRALYAPLKSQENDTNILKLIKQRSQ